MDLYLPLCPSWTYIYHMSLMDLYLPYVLNGPISTICPSWTYIYHGVPHGPISTMVSLMDLYLPWCPSRPYIYHGVPHPLSSSVSPQHGPQRDADSLVCLAALHLTSVAAAALSPTRNQIPSFRFSNVT